MRGIIGAVAQRSLVYVKVRIASEQRSRRVIDRHTVRTPQFRQPDGSFPSTLSVTPRTRDHLFFLIARRGFETKKVVIGGEFVKR